MTKPYKTGNANSSIMYVCVILSWAAMIKQLFGTGTRYLVSKWRYISTGCLAITISYIKNCCFGEGEKTL